MGVDVRHTFLRYKDSFHQMRKIIFAISLLILILQSMAVSGKMRCTPIYLFGTSASFNDSIVYFTDIQILDSAWIDEKTDFLVNRSEYSHQLREHFNMTGHPNRTCLVSFATTEKEILKKYAKMRKQFKGTDKKPKNYAIREIDDDEFHFKAIKLYNIDESEVVMEASKKTSKRAEKSKMKKSKGKLNEKRSSDASVPSPTMPPRR